jgi:parallel beta-helix repeat protein
MTYRAISLLFAASVPALAVTPVTACGTVINTSGNYQLANDLNCPGSTGDAAITIAASNVTLQFAGHKITGSGSFGVLAFIKGGSLDHIGIAGPGQILGSSSGGFDAGIQMTDIDYGQISQMTIVGYGTYGIVTFGCHFATIGANVVSHSSRGITAHGFSTTISGNDVSGNAIGIEDVTAGATIQNNVANGNSIAGISLEDSGARVSGNVTNGNGQVGIVAIGSITNDVIFSNTSARGNGVDLSDPSSCAAGNIWGNNTFGTADAACIH